MRARRAGPRFPLRCSLPGGDHLKLRLFVDMDDVVEADAAIGKVGKAGGARDAEPRAYRGGAMGQVDKHAQSLIDALRPGDAKGFMARVDLRSCRHHENGARRIGRLPGALR